MTKPVSVLLHEMGIPEERHGAVVAVFDQLDAARESGAERPEIDRLLIALGALVEDCFGFGEGPLDA